MAYEIKLRLRGETRRVQAVSHRDADHVLHVTAPDGAVHVFDRRGADRPLQSYVVYRDGVAVEAVG